ncbi:putative RNA-directed DNA polymerase from transposon X-element [Trichonephila clavata]|uniref:Putative RNA-directed DNA polymerase from transposon X-element n=1 Tax=Trichonephila clavata TaxID=2740835 RepID=A0A8X6FR58_TRICU|nr:putative RNA-directed DNA polymerase from transposon X-element [Trichonephila clavata]
MLQHLSESSILSLLLLFNRIWETQVFSTQWCHAPVLLLPKPGKDPTSANNYRPIALTGCLSKLMERTVSARLMFHLESHNLLSPLQSGFRKSRSTTDNLIRLETSIREAFVKKQYNISVFFDIKKAYDMSWSAKALNILKVLANTRWGADRISLLRLYRALIRSKLNYGSVVYSSACKSLLKILDPVHHQGLRLCLGAFRTSPVESLYAEADEPPLDLQRKYLCLNHFMKIQSMKTNTAYSYLFNFSLYDFNSHHSSLTYSQPFHFRIRDLINDLNLNIGRIALCKISEVPPFKVIYPKVDFTLSCYSKTCTLESTYRTLYLEHRELFSDYEPIFMDGSKSESHVGLAVVSLSTVITDALPISASIYTAELHALRIAIEHISLSHGHAGITGNELADTAARSATGSSERFPIPHSDLKACFRQKLQSVWQSNWDQQTENKLHSVMPVLAPTVPSSSNRCEQVIWTRLRLGHTRLMHRHLLFGEPPPYCEIYNLLLSVKHILCDCPHSNHLRHQLFNSVDFTISYNDASVSNSHQAFICKQTSLSKRVVTFKEETKVEGNSKSLDYKIKTEGN